MAPGHYLNQCWNIVNWTLENKLQWNFKWNSNIFIQEMRFKMSWETSAILTRPQCVNSLRLRQNGRHFPDDNFKYIFLNENVWISIKISPKFVPKGPINNIPALVEIMAWCLPGYKPLCEPMMVSLLMHICFTWPQSINSLSPSDAYMCQETRSPLI